MATCSFIKESKQTVGAMGRVLRYVSQEKKTVDPDGREYLSGINCGAEVAQQSFMATKNLYSKASGTFFYHYVQSFSPQENVTPAQAHQIALELAERFFPGCEVLVATHVDAEHPHSHFVVNSVHPDTGKKLHFTPRTLEQMRAASDQLCLEHGLSTLKPYQQNRRTKGLRTGEYRAAVRGESRKSSSSPPWRRSWSVPAAGRSSSGKWSGGITGCAGRTPGSVSSTPPPPG